MQNIWQPAIVTRRLNSGFSLIELVIVIVILGILAATALPRFLDVTDEARVAAVEGVAGGFATGVILTRAQWEAEARPSESGINTVMYDTERVYLTTPNSTQAADGSMAAGFPMSSDSADVSVGSATMSGEMCFKVWNSILQNPARSTSDFSDVGSNGDYYTFYITANADTCIFHQVSSLTQNSSGSYTNPGTDLDASNNFTYQSTTGVVLTNIKTN